MQNLERNWPVVAEVVGQVYDGHPSMPELAVKAIAVCQEGLKLGEEVWQ